jgi:hypothetical protein
MNGFKFITYKDHEECWIDTDEGWKQFSDVKLKPRKHRTNMEDGKND